MKKLLSILLSMILIVSSMSLLTACGGKKYTVKFDTDGGSVVSDQVIEEGGLVAKPSDPTKQGYIFNGWFYEDMTWDFTTKKVDKDYTITAKWIQADPNCNIYATEYTGLITPSNIAQYELDTETNMAVENGVIISPYYTLKINGTSYPVYGTRAYDGYNCVGDIHSFLYVDIEKIDASKSFVLNVELTGTEENAAFNKKKLSAVVLPESTGVVAEINNKTVSATITEYGSYSFAINGKQEQAFTLMVKEKEDPTASFGSYDIKYIEPGDYSTPSKITDLEFSTEDTVYYFKKGMYKVDHISVNCDNVILYFEKGAYLLATPKDDGITDSQRDFLLCNSRKNIKILGRGLFDYSACCGSSIDGSYSSDKDSGSVYLCENVVYEGLTLINSQCWTVKFHLSKNIQARDLLGFAYRMYADGVMLSNSQNAVIEDCFLRTGDDAFETKSMEWSGSANDKFNDNILFQNNACWTDKAVAYGCIYESYFDTTNVTFKNNSVGFATGSWSDHLGSCVIQMGNHKDRKISNIHFENIEIYKSYNKAIINCYVGGTGGAYTDCMYGTIDDIYFKNITCKYNEGAFMVNLQTLKTADCAIGKIYVENIVSNNIKLTQSNRDSYVKINVKAGYNSSDLSIA